MIAAHDQVPAPASAAGRLVRLTYYGSRFVSQVGQGLFLAALFMLAGTGDSPVMGLSSIVVAMMAAAIIASLPAGALADRLGLGGGLATGAALRLVAITSAFAVIGHAEYAWASAFVYSAASQVFSPAELALVPVIRPRRSSGAHVILVVLQYAGQAASIFALAPALYLLGGATAILIGAVAAYALVLTATLFLAARLRGSAGECSVSARRVFDLTRALRFYAIEPRATYAAGLLAFADMTTKSMAISLPVYFSNDLALGRGQMIALAGIGVVGAAAGFSWIGRSLAPSAPRTMRLALIAIIGAALALAGLGDGLRALTEVSQLSAIDHFAESRNLDFALAFPVALIFGLCFSIAPIGARAVLTETAPVGQHARVFAAQAALTDLLVLAPLLLVGFGAQIAGPRVIFLFVGALGVTVFLLLESARLQRSLMARYPASAPSAAVVA